MYSVTLHLCFFHHFTLTDFNNLYINIKERSAPGTSLCFHHLSLELKHDGWKKSICLTWQDSEKDLFKFPVKITRGIWNYMWQILPGLRLLLSDIPEVVSHKTIASAGGRLKKSYVINWMLTLFMSEIWHHVSLSLNSHLCVFTHI